jgi:hypothetical protein
MGNAQSASQLFRCESSISQRLGAPCAKYRARASPIVPYLAASVAQSALERSNSRIVQDHSGGVSRSGSGTHQRSRLKGPTVDTLELARR